MSSQFVALEHIREQLNLRRSELQARGKRVEADLARRNEPLTADFSDRAIQMQNDEPLQVIGAAVEDEIAAIDEALERLVQGLYGVCKRCDGAISSSRLAAVPQAVLCEKCIRH